MHLTAAEERADAEVTLGRGAEVVTELTDLVAAHPVRERLVAALIRALVAAGRDSEALLVFQRAREALGVDPSPELAAFHVALLRGATPCSAGPRTPSQLASRLDDRFRLLTSGSRAALPRRKTLRAVVDWSWELPTNAERMTLRRLSVFSGGASLEATEGDVTHVNSGAELTVEEISGLK